MITGRSATKLNQDSRFLAECYQKEQSVRLKRHAEKQLQLQGDEQPSSDSDHSKQYNVFKKKLEATTTRPTEELLRFQEEALQRIREQEEEKAQALAARDYRLLASVRPASELKPDMRIPDEEVMSTLYDGISREGKGRCRYLRERNRAAPEEKYYYPLLSSWQYGWSLDDVIDSDSLKNPVHGRNRIVEDTFYRRTGVPMKSPDMDTL